MDLSRVISIILGVAFILSSCMAQDVGRLRRMMLMRQREQALRRGLLPFGPGRGGGSGIPPPVVARLAMLERQRALSNPFLRSPFGPIGPPFRTFGGRSSLGLPGPFRGSGPIPGPGDISRFDLSTLGFDGGAPFVGTDGISAAGPSGTMTPDGQTGGDDNIFGQQPTQAAEFLEQTRGTVESRQPPEARTPMAPPRPGFRPRPPGRAFTENQAQNRPNWPTPRVERRPPPPLPPLPLPLRADPGFSPPNNRQDDSMFPETAPHSPTNRGPPPVPAPRNSPNVPNTTRFLPSEPNILRLPRRPRTARDDSRGPPQTPFGPQMSLPPEQSRMPPRPPRFRDPRDRFGLQPVMPRSQRPSQERQMTGPPRPRVFPTVPDIVQIPAVAPTTQGQGVSIQQPVGGLTQEGAVPPGGAVGPPMVGPSFGFGPTSSGGQGSAIFPSQSAQDPITRQPGPSFADGSFSIGLEFGGESTMPMLPVFPNGPAFPFPFPGGVQILDPSDQLFFGSSGFPTDTFSSGTTIPGFPGSGFDSSEVSDIFRPGFGFVGPSSSDSGSAFTSSGRTSIGAAADAAGPAFTTRGQSGSQEHNFNIQFQPLPLTQPFQPMVPEIPERQPEPSQMGLGPVVVTNTGINRPVGIANQGRFQSDKTPTGFQIGFSVQPDGLFDLSNQDTVTFSGFTPDAQNTGSMQVSDWFTSGTVSDGIINLDTGIQGPNFSATTISEKTVESTEQILKEDGFIPAATKGAAVISDLSASRAESASSKPTVDMSTAIESINGGNKSQSVVDLSVQSGTVAKESKVTTVTRDASRTIVDVTSGSKVSKMNVIPESPFVTSIKQDFSFFLVDDTSPPNEMPPITFNAPEPPSIDTSSLEMPPVTFKAPEPPVIDTSNLDKPMADQVQPLTGLNMADMTTPDNTANGGFI